jgi:hypothetical protein
LEYLIKTLRNIYSESSVFNGTIVLKDALEENKSFLWSNNNFETGYIWQGPLEIHKQQVNIKNSMKYCKII